VTEMPSALCGW